jgi:hypothetical protein
MNKSKLWLAALLTALSAGTLVFSAAPVSAAEVTPAAADAQAEVPFKPGGLVLVFTDEGGIVLGRFIGLADDDPNFVLVAGEGEGVIRAPLTNVIPLPGPGGSSG